MSFIKHVALGTRRNINSGFATNLFSIQRGVRQGDPLPPLLFTLALEILACQIRQDHNIKGIEINSEEIKKNYLHLFRCLEVFLRYSVLKVNNDKTESISTVLNKLDLHIQSVKILKYWVYFLTITPHPE